ncbi:MAG: DUF4437 domain-containing protein [Bryobacterales bacterium]|nr:DUF4437 domain-containing protein [Bryobacterales bacterium]
MRFNLLVALVLAVSAACSGPHTHSQSGSSEPVAEATSRVVLVSEAEWQQLNPKRGDKSPRAATLWGDRDGPGPSGFLLKPVDGFSSPPHVHTAPYHGVVISGTIHNAEPSASDLFLPPGSFWTQPEGGVHITACKGDCLAYIEFEGGYDVLPVEHATGDPVTAVTMQPTSIPWGDPSGTTASANGPKVAELWGAPQGDQPGGSLVRLPAGKTGTIRSDSGAFHAVAIDGRAKHREVGKNHVTPLDPGTYFMAQAGSEHRVSCVEEADCTLYVRSRGSLQVSSAGQVEP